MNAIKTAIAVAALGAVCLFAASTVKADDRPVMRLGEVFEHPVQLSSCRFAEPLVAVILEHQKNGYDAAVKALLTLQVAGECADIMVIMTPLEVVYEAKLQFPSEDHKRDAAVVRYTTEGHELFGVVFDADILQGTGI